MRASRLAPLLALALFLGGCAVSAGSGSSRSDPNVITLEELQTLPTGTAHDAVSRLRPRWLRTRMSEPPVVFLDGTRLGRVDALRTIQASQLQEIRFLDSRDATTRYGIGFTGGAIELRTRRN